MSKIHIYTTDSVTVKFSVIKKVFINTTEKQVTLSKEKPFIATVISDKPVNCIISVVKPFFISSSPGKQINITLFKNKKGKWDYNVAKDDYLNNFIRSFHRKIFSFFTLEKNEKITAKLTAIENFRTQKNKQLKQLKNKLPLVDYQMLKFMIKGRLDAAKLGFLKLKYPDINNKNFEFLDHYQFPEHYFIYVDNFSVAYGILNDKVLRNKGKYLSKFPFEEKLTIIKTISGSQNFRDLFYAVFAKNKISNNTKVQKKQWLLLLKNQGISKEAYTFLSAIEAGTAKGNKIGAPAKFLETLVPLDKNFSFENLKNKTIYIDNWATWCGPCVSSIIKFIKNHPKILIPKDVAILYVSFDNTEMAWKEFIKKTPFPKENIVHLYNKEGINSAYAKYYNIGGLPNYFVVDKQGRIKDTDPISPEDKNFDDYLKKIAQ